MRQIFMIMGMSMLLSAGFSRDNTGVVTDSLTGLQWQDDYSDNDGSFKELTWQEALTYCQELRLGNSIDWRLPNIVELKSIRKTSGERPAIDKSFLNSSDDFCWSSTTPIRNTGNVWGIDFYDGLSSQGSKTEIHLVRCVRGGV